jgi:outer membrane protein TolC
MMKKPFLTALFLIFANSGFAQPLLTLQQSLHLGAEQNYEIRIAKTDERIADTRNTLGNAGFLPTVSLVAGMNQSINNTRQSFVNGLSIERDNAENTSHNVIVELNWTLFQGFRRFARLQQNELDSRLASLNREGISEAITALITGVYYDIVRQQQTIQVLNDAVELSNDRISLAEGKFTIGTGSKLDVNQARIDLNNDRVALLRQQVIFHESKITLNRLLGRDAHIQYAVQDSIPVNRALDLEELQQTALEKNIGLQRAGLSLAKANQLIRQEKSSRYPVVTFNADYSYFRSQSDAGFLQTNRNRGYTVGIGLNMTLFDGFNNHNRIQVAKLQATNQDLLMQKEKVDLFAELQSTHKRYRNSLMLADIESTSVALARENMNIALERYRLGSITSLELRDIQNKFIQAQARLISAHYQAKLAETDLLLQSNELSEK